MAPRARLSSKHQIVIPKDVRARLGLEPGDSVVFLEGPDGVRIERAGKEDDPFAAFHEWASPADDAAYADL
jgi:AbrB family looped-hinge helix DNA binding protein